MTIRCVTTCHAEGWEQYGRNMFAGWQAHVPHSLVWYTEGYQIPPGVEAKDNAALPDLQAFKRRWAFYKPPYYLYDVVRFSHKVFAVYDALRDWDDLGLWIDADMIPYRDVPQDYIRSLIEPGDYIALFRRKGMYSECGFWIVDCKHPAHKEFMERLVGLYRDDGFKQYREWHDSYLMDMVVNAMEREGKISVTNLSGKFAGEEHPMAKVDLARYWDHLKGPDRKELGMSPENEFRK